MQDLKLIPLSDLLDLLVEKTAQYLGMIHGKGSQEELQKCRELMTALQLEIETRKAKKIILLKLFSPESKHQLMFQTKRLVIYEAPLFLNEIIFW